VEDFEGYDLLDIRPEVDTDDMSWLFPPKGPGDFKDMTKKRKKRTKH